MYLTCNQCKESSHISTWNRLGKYSFVCPNCGCPKSCETEFNESFKKDMENWKNQEVV